MRSHVPGWAGILLFVVGYVLLTQWLLPKLGFST